MTLSEIETILEELALRHDNLSTELLTTLLLSAGWEEKNIKEAVTLFKQNPPKKPSNIKAFSAPVTTSASATPEVSSAKTEKEEITFYQQDGAEEKKLPGFLPDSSVKKEEQPKQEEGMLSKIVSALPEVTIVMPEETSIVSPEVNTRTQETSNKRKEDVKELQGERRSADVREQVAPKVVEEKVITQPIPPPVVTTPTPPVFKEPEPQSLVMHDEPVKERPKMKETEIPSDLPLLPFESSPHVWSFSRYKNAFHGESAPEKEKVIPEVVEPVIKKEVFPFIAKPQSVTFVKEVKKESNITADDEEEEVLLEKTPLTRGDESLVFLAGMMLLVIILILGYMYSNGRL